MTFSFASAISISPVTAYTNDNLVCSSSTGGAIYKWYNPEYFSTGSTISNDLTTKGQTWTCKIYINILTGYPLHYVEIPTGEQVSIIISNTAPTAPSISVSSGPYFANSVITSTASGSTDADTDLVSYEYRFTRNGNVLTSTNTLACNGVCLKENTISAEVRAFDGTDYSAWTTSSLIISNSAPYNLSLNVAPANIYVGTQITASTTAQDIDVADILTYTYQFYNVNDNTVLQAWSSTPTYTVTASSAHDTIRVYARASDGTDTIGTYTDISVLNTVPVITNPGTQTLYTNHPFSLQIAASDVDNDALTFTDNSPIFDISSSGLISFTPTDVQVGNYSVDLTVNDGTTTSTITATFNVILDNPSVSASTIIPATAYNLDDLNCYATLNDVLETSLMVQWQWYNGTNLISSGNTTVTSGTSTLISTLPNINTVKNEVWTCTLIPSDGFTDGIQVNTSRTISNTVPVLSTNIPTYAWDRNDNMTVILGDYFSDIDGDDLTFSSTTPANIAVQIDNTTNTATLIPDVNWYGARTITFTAYDNSGASVNSNAVTLNVGYNTISNSWIAGILYNGIYDYGFISNIYVSTLIDSSVTGPTISVTESYLDNSNVTDSTLFNCTVLDSELEGVSCLNSYIDPSSIKYSNVNGSTITDSHIWYSNATNSIITDSTLDYVISDNTTFTNSVVENITGSNNIIVNTNLSDTAINDANISDGIINSGTITMPNGTAVNVTSPTNLSEYVEYAPDAIIVSPGSGTAGSAVSFTSGSTDINMGTQLNDSLSYFWDFGDGTNSTLANPAHTYSSTGTYTVNLTVTDSFGQSDQTSINVTINAPVQTSSGGSGGGDYYVDLRDGSMTRDFTINGEAGFYVNSTRHTIALTKIDKSYVVIALQSNPQIVILNLKETKKFDLDKNGYYDFYMILNNITSPNSANIRFGLINEKIVSANPVVNTTNATKTITNVSQNVSNIVKTIVNETKAENKTSPGSITGNVIKNVEYTWESIVHSKTGSFVRKNFIAIIFGAIFLFVLVMMIKLIITVKRLTRKLKRK